MSYMVICMYCRCYIRTEEGDTEGMVSHGICEECETKVNAEIDGMFPKSERKSKGE